MNITFAPSESYEQALDRAAQMWGIEPEYGDTWGHLHTTTPETKKGILKALGVPVDSREELDRAIENRLWKEWSRLLPPVLVRGETDRSLWINIPEELEGLTAQLEIRWEGGQAERSTISLADLNTIGRSELRGVRFVRKEAPLQPNAPLGYHEVEVTIRPPDAEPRSAVMRLILCPDRAYVPPAVRDGARTAGLAIALYGLRSKRNWGCGDFTDLENIIDWLAGEVGAAYIGLNPLHAIANRQPFNISPYLPSSSFFKNPIYLDVERVEDFRNSPRARAFFSRPEVQAEIEALRSAEFVEYERVWALKTRGLKLAFLHFLPEYRRNSPRAAEFRDFIEREGEMLDRFATWCALDEWIHRRNPNVWVWPDWPEEFRNPDSTATRRFRGRYWRSVLYHKYVQWQIDLQLESAQAHARNKGLSIGLYHDLALATDRCGADFWAYRPFYVSGCRVGAPPDNFSPKGQDWSFPPPNSEHHRETGYRLFAESIRRNCRHGGALRIDHAMRFFRLYWIPEGMDPAGGAYVRDRFEELLHIVALESVRQRVAIVGEDLGTVTPDIRRALERFGVYGYKVPYFEKDGHGRFKLPWDYPAQAMVTSATHDLPTLAGFWKARDIEARHNAGLLLDEANYHHQLAERASEKQKLLDALFAAGLLPDSFPRDAAHVPELTGELHNALVGWLALAPSAFMTLNQEDLTKETEQQNLPATVSEYPNWRRKMIYTLEELGTNPAVRDFVRMFRSWLERTGRVSLPLAAD
ncbi:MAG TPA: 4-alpha-glucanotransferase [Bryobacteraceae bacterium]|nr:4-alpha-glucanotransferase [Bryobacteraceae bacterium]HPU72933.1 4-alpha-glucanotransferase [Bryobacteraceae bacterium]